MQMTINVPDNLPPAIVQQYIHNVESQMNLMAQLTQNLHKPNAVKKRVFGQYHGQMQIADDFDDELPLDFWLGESA